MSDAEGSEKSLTKPETVAGVFGVGLGLCLIVLFVLTIVGYGPRAETAASVLDGSFVVEALPEGLTVEPLALLLPGGEQVVTIGNGQPLPVTPKELLEPSPFERMGPGGLPGAPPEGGPGAPPFEKFDWSSVEPEATDTLPARVYLVHYPERGAPALLTMQFRGLRWRDLSEIPAKGGSAVIDGGKLEWNGYAADFVRERRFLEGGSFRDTMRVNLSLGRSCWVAYAIWGEREEGSEEKVREVLAVVRPAGESTEEGGEHGVGRTSSRRSR